jgi:glycerol transport system ATP-binding protein
VPAAQVKARVAQIADMLELGGQLNHRASGLSADVKQKISLGRGLVRPDVSAVLFDEPLTVIDPQLKWQLRRKLKQIHQELKLTLIYVTHDQVEALTFAQQVMVMSQGRIVQTGTPEALFERPAHTFVGHFIGSPGMNLLPVSVQDGRMALGSQSVSLPAGLPAPQGELTLGIRPEYTCLAASGLPGVVDARVDRVQDIGTYRLVTASVGPHVIRARLGLDEAVPAEGATAGFAVVGMHTCFYRNQELVA